MDTATLYQQLATPDNPHIVYAIQEVKRGIQTRIILKEYMPRIDTMPASLIDDFALWAAYRILCDCGFVCNVLDAYKQWLRGIERSPFFYHIRAMIVAGVE